MNRGKREDDGEPASAEARASDSRRILAVDYGRKRIGLALSDEMELTAQPLAILERVNRREDLRRLRDICRRHSVGRILVGHPVHMSGAAGEMAEEAARFAQRLHKELGIEVELLDERLTSWEAAQIVAETRGAGRPKDKPRDDVAAAILLREFLEQKHQQVRMEISEKD
ncbi:MAG TPA: Holliday junction resolvase RuvX [Candidatus Acidoferrales bacterium]|jgi:putative Holliday junction resolvase